MTDIADTLDKLASDAVCLADEIKDTVDQYRATANVWSSRNQKLVEEINELKAVSPNMLLEGLSKDISAIRVALENSNEGSAVPLTAYHLAIAAENSAKQELVRLGQKYAKLEVENERLRSLVDAAVHELGVPGEDTPGPIWEAYRLLAEAIGPIGADIPKPRYEYASPSVPIEAHELVTSYADWAKAELVQLREKNIGLEAELTQAKDKTVRFDLNALSIEQHEKVAVELVELRAKYAALVADYGRMRKAWADTISDKQKVIDELHNDILMLRSQVNDKQSTIEGLMGKLTEQLDEIERYKLLE